MLWDEQLEPHLASLAGLNQAQRWRLSIACMEDVRPVLDEALADVRMKEIHAFFSLALALLHEADRASEVPSAIAQDLVARASGWIDETTPPGIWDFAMGLLTLLSVAGRVMSPSDVTQCMGVAYQVVLNAEVLSVLEREATEAEVMRLEEANEACVACIARQTEAIESERIGTATELRKR